MADPQASHYISHRSLVERSLRVIEATKEIIRDYTLRHESPAQVEPASEQSLIRSVFQREKTKEILDAPRLSQAVTERAVESLAAPPPPFRRLPTEIILQIFSYAVKQEEENRRDQMKGWKLAPIGGVPIILAHVCSQWNAIVHRNPALWKHILIPVNSKYIMSEDLVARRVARWMAQGVQQNQSLFIEGWNDIAMQRLITHAGSHAKPWRSINVAIGYASPTKQWDAQSVYATKVKLYRFKGQSSLSFFLPLLQKASEWAIMGTPPVWGNSPWISLVSLKLQSFAARNGEQVEPLPFGALELCELLNAAPCLKELQLDFVRTPRMSPILNTLMPNMVEHQKIESLSLHLHHISDNMGLFGLQTIMPSLRSLRILSLGPGALVLGEPSNISVGGWDQTRSLSLHGLEIAVLPRLLALFVYLPNVDTLNLRGLHVNALVHLLNIRYRQPKSPTPELPLSQLTRVVLRGTDIQGGTLIDMIQTRLADIRAPAIARRLTDVEIYDNPGAALEEWKCVQNLLETGRSLIQIGH